MSNPSTRIHFKFGSLSKGGESRLKLVVYFKDNSHALRYSFDGRPNQDGSSIKTYDRAKYFNEANAQAYLEDTFQKEFRYDENLNYAFIGINGTTGKQGIKAVWNKDSQMWISKNTDDTLRYQRHEQLKTQIQCYTFRLAVKTYEPVKWHSFYTDKKSIVLALMDLINQFNNFIKANPTIRLQERGEIYGHHQKLYDRYEREVPRFCWFDLQSNLPKYLSTQRVITDYQNYIASNQNFESLISNL